MALWAPLLVWCVVALQCSSKVFQLPRRGRKYADEEIWHGRYGVARLMPAVASLGDFHHFICTPGGDAYNEVASECVGFRSGGLARDGSSVAVASPDCWPDEDQRLRTVPVQFNARGDRARPLMDAAA